VQRCRLPPRRLANRIFRLHYALAYRAASLHPGAVSDPDFEIAFRRPGLMPAWALGRLGGLALVILAGVLTVQADRRGAHMRMIGYLAEFALLSLALFGWQLWLRRRGGLPPIRLGPEVITLPRSMSSLRTTLIPYAEIRCITLLGHGMWARLLGALAVITWRFRADLPGGYRLPWQVWVFLFGINMLLLPSLNPQVDKAAHAGGLLAGLLMGVLLVGGRADLRDVAQRHVRVQSAMAILGAAWIAGLAGGLAHAENPAGQAADRYTLAHAMLAHDHFAPGVKDVVAWAIAADSAAPLSALSDARLLAYRGVEEAERAPRGGDSTTERARAAVLGTSMDTEAALEYRLGYPAEAAALQVAINDRTTTAWGSHLALFLEQNYRRSGVHMVGSTAPLPMLTLEHGVMRLDMAAPAERGGEVFALLHHDGATIGVVQVRLPPGFTGSQILPLPVKSGAPTAEAPDSVWTDGRATLDVAWFDHTSCHCAYPSTGPLMGPYFYRYSPQLASLP
jgi:hypothetical protein